MIDSIVKYPGGKYKELKYILPNIPPKIINYYEPFVGGGSVYFAIENKADRLFINDKSTDLMLLYNAVKNQDQLFFKKVNRISYIWEISNDYADTLTLPFKEAFQYLLHNSESNSKEISIRFVTNKEMNEFSHLFTNSYQLKEFLIETINRKIRFLIKQVNNKKKITDQGIIDIVQTAVKSAIYTYFRKEFNELRPNSDISKSERAALYLFIRQYAYSSMFRFSKSGNFNVPYGGKTYNNINLADKAKKYHDKKLVSLLRRSYLESLDFEEFLNIHKPQKNDFVFLDPPYDSEFSTYDKNKFDAKEQKRLAHFLINKIQANWMLVIKDTKLINDIYVPGTFCANGGTVHLTKFDKVYSVNFKNRNNRETNHLIITNYSLKNNIGGR